MCNKQIVILMSSAFRVILPIESKFFFLFNETESFAL